MSNSCKSTRALLVSIILLAAFFPWRAGALPEVKSTFPRLANYFLHWTLLEEEARQLARFDLIILDAEVAQRSPHEFALLRRLNPRAIILAYVPAAEVRRDVENLRGIAPLRYRLGAQIPEQWYLKDAAGSRRSFWPGTWIVDVTSSWAEYLTQFVRREILSTGLWDGVFYDNAWDDIAHFARGVPDLDRDGVQDDAAKARRAWQDGLRAIYRRTAELAPDKFVFENDGPMYAPEVHGVLLENFPHKGWARHMEELRRVRREARTPAVAVLNANTFNTGAREDFRAARYGLTTALLAEAFYSFDFGDQDHGQTWWYDEYGAFLGEAIAPARRRDQVVRGLWQRDFEKGIVLVNSTSESQRLELPIEVEKIRGLQDPITNNGALVRELVVGANDGLIVLRPLQTIVGVPFENGVFARVFNISGEQVRAGFFAFDRSESPGATVVRIDLDGDGNVEKPRLSLGPTQGLALGDLTGDGVKEIVVGENGAVRVYRGDGVLLVSPFFPFGPRWRGSVSVGVGDLNKDGFAEIVVGAGEGGGPMVRVFSGKGRLLSGGFFAYDPRFRGGVRVAVGDLDQDGRAEIVTGPGVGGGPQVRVFSGSGQSIGSGFFAYNQASREGVTPLVTDVDGDGKNEILALTKEVL